MEAVQKHPRDVDGDIELVLREKISDDPELYRLEFLITMPLSVQRESA
ncbi:MAG: hypothetical protein HRU19_03750 [Pseudobacteriovorax sp.]|nr:hypothetical protein [Pseudobacteriovorax sp.]